MSMQPEEAEEESQGMPEMTPVKKNRLTVVETVYHQVLGEDPVSVESRFERELQSDEQMYQRRKVATEEPQPLDLGWVVSPGMFVIKNTEGQVQQANPTPEQLAKLALKTIIVFQDGLRFKVLPGETFRFSPEDPTAIRLKCLSGSARYTISVIPS